MSRPAIRVREDVVPLTVVMPAYNEEAAIEGAVHEVCGRVLDAVPGARLVVVDDGSRDQTGMILDQLAEGDARIEVVHRANGGHGPALLAGLARATGQWVLLVDSDRQIPLAVFPRLWEAAQGRDAVLGVRAVRHDPPFRLALTRIVRLVVRVLLGVELRDANVPMKLVRRARWLEAAAVIPADAATPSLLLAVYLRARGCDAVEVEVPHAARATGSVSLRRWRLLRFCARAFRELLAFRGRLVTRPAVAVETGPAALG